jgi:murein DD-endopeptidase MepM/ murein hydrolase activator NlpD
MDRPENTTPPTRALTTTQKRTVADAVAEEEKRETERERRRAISIFGRFTSHAAILAVSVIAFVLAGLQFGSAEAAGRQSANPGTPGGEQGNGRLGRSPTVLQRSDRLGAVNDASGPKGPGQFGGEGAVITRDAGVILPAAAAVPGAADAPGGQNSPGVPVVVEARAQIITYRVQPGDALLTIAQQFGLSPDTLAWSNPAVEDNPEFLRVGQELTILPVNGVYYTVKSGDTLAGIAKRFKVEPSSIENYQLNDFGGGLQAGAKIVVPAGIKAVVERAVAAPSVTQRRAPSNQAGVSVGSGAATGAFSWPTQGTITQGFWAYHRALDIANSIGTPIYAADGGYVAYAGWSNVGYGYMILIEHGNGFRTLYGHLSYYYVDQGQYVGKGQVIGAMGSTGNSTGPHLHFEIRYGGATQNPNAYLPY